VSSLLFLFEKDGSTQQKICCHHPFRSFLKVDSFALAFIKKHGLRNCAKIAKTDFKNYQRVTKTRPKNEKSIPFRALGALLLTACEPRDSTPSDTSSK
jgi:hypothetical protein